MDTPEVRDVCVSVFPFKLRKQVLAFQLFRRKVAIWEPLFHPNVVKVHGMAYINEGVYFVRGFPFVFDQTDA